MYPRAQWITPEPTALDPRPIQLRRGQRRDGRTLSVAEPSEWGGAACSTRDPVERGALIAEHAVQLAGRPDLLARLRDELVGRDLGCFCAAGLPCHRDVLIDFADRDGRRDAGGHAVGVTVPRPWASLTLLPECLSPMVVQHRSWAPDYRGVLCILAARHVDDNGVAAAEGAGFDAAWHSEQTGWLGAAVLVDVHPARDCCPPWGRPQRHRDRPLYHWVFRRGARLARPAADRGFLGLRRLSWAVLARPNAFALGEGKQPPPRGAYARD
jgi:hypothetical protein